MFFGNDNVSTHLQSLALQGGHDDFTPLKVPVLFASTHSGIAVTEGQGNLSRGISTSHVWLVDVNKAWHISA